MYNGYESYQEINITESANSVPLNTKLQHVLESIGDLVRTTNIVAINANISAARMSSAEGRVFEQIAKEMRDISQHSLREIQGLNKILQEVRELSEMINLAGRQRMLAQKIMKLVCLKRIDGSTDADLEKEFTDTESLFNDSHKKLAKSPLNSKVIEISLVNVWNCWLKFRTQLDQSNLRQSNNLNNELISLINTSVNHYQALAG